MENKTKQPKRHARLKCFRFTIDTINIVQVIVSCLIIIGAISIQTAFRDYHFLSWYSALYNLPSLWIATGCFLAVFSVFGLFATMRNSTKLINIYAVSIICVFILQMAAAITGFTLLPNTRNIVSRSLNSMMEDYAHNYRYRKTMDWIQETYECCGMTGPADWEHLPGLPSSCCPYDSHREHCDINYHHDQGCRSLLVDTVFRGILLIASTSLVIGFLQMWAITCAFVLAIRVRENKTQRDIQKWAASENLEKKVAPEQIDGYNINYV